jgi:DNA-binding response OmpR family regulator
MITKTVLVVEDEMPLLRAIQKKFEKNGFSVATARTCDQALGYFEDIENINAIWLDHYLIGDCNGIDFLGKIKNSDSPWKTIPVFIVSNTAGQEEKKTYLHLGVDKYYIKSENRLDTIIGDIKKYLE